MEILTAVLCDSAADYQGKLCVLGAFDTIAAPRFPIVHPHCSVAVRLLFKDADVGKHALAIALIDPDGKMILPAGPPRWDFELHKIPEETFFLSRNFVLNFQGLTFPKPAQYSFDITLDGRIIARIPLQVVQIRSQSQ